MKRYIHILLSSAILVLMLIVLTPANAQEPPHPPSVGHGVNGNHSPSNAPIGGGIGILLAFGLAYGIKKYSDYRKQKALIIKR